MTTSKQHVRVAPSAPDGLSADPTRFAKVPAVSAVFWVVKILSTGMGEAASDALMRTFGLVAAAVTGSLLVLCLLGQMAARRYHVVLYWLTVAMVSIFGTMAADLLHSLGLSLWFTSALYLLAVLVVFGLWRRDTGTLSFAAITRGRAEAFYWGAVLATFALGTAVGDLTADVWGWGNLASGLVFAALILIPAAAARWLRLDAVAAFWAAYVLTRPLGASFADWMGMPSAHGGLGWGPPMVAVLWAVPTVAVVSWLAVATHRRRVEVG